MIKLHKPYSDEEASEIAKNTMANFTWMNSADNNKIGDRMADGTIFAGISPDTNKPMYVEPADALYLKDFNAAAKYAKNLQVGNKKDFRVPSKAELNVLFQNKDKGALKGAFNVTGSYVTVWYWSSTPNSNSNAWIQRFSDGQQVIDSRYFDNSVRCVR